MDGVVYTRRWVVELILDMVGYTSDRDLAEGVAIEPSCGCGAFLGVMIERLLVSACCRGKLSYAYLQGCIRAYDVDPVAVEKSRQLAVSLLVRAGLSEAASANVAAEWMVCADALLADMPAADWVVGNPPYVRASRIDRDLRKQYMEALSCVTMGTDLYIGFFEKGLSVLKDDGRLCFICADRWLQNQYGSRLRKMIASDYHISVLARMHEANAFENEVAAYPAITLIDHGRGETRFVSCSEDFSASDAANILRWLHDEVDSVVNASAGRLDTTSRGGLPLPIGAPEKIQMVLALEESMPRLEECGIEVGIGIASGCDDVFVTKDAALVEEDRLLPLFYMRDWRSGTPQERYLVNPWNDSGGLVDLDNYPRLRRYLFHNERRLRDRRIAKDNPECWYRTLDKLNGDLAGCSMLLFPDMALSSEPVLSNGDRYPHHNCYWLTSDSWDLNALGGLLMSDIAESFVDAYGVKMRGRTLRFQAQYLRKIHVPRYEAVPSDVLEELARAFLLRDREAASAAARKAYFSSGEAA